MQAAGSVQSTTNCLQSNRRPSHGELANLTDRGIYFSKTSSCIALAHENLMRSRLLACGHGASVQFTISEVRLV